MTRNPIPWTTLTPMLTAALLVAACGGAGPATAPPLEGARIGGPFQLLAETGRAVTERDFPGQYRIMYFGFASCPDICPTDLAVIGQGLKRFEKADGERAAKVTPVFVSVDGGRDTPAVLATYTDAFHPRLLGATGDEAQIAAAAKAYAVAYSVEPGATPADTVVNHSRVATLFGPDGAPLAVLPTDDGPDAVAAELDKWVA